MNVISHLVHMFVYVRITVDVFIVPPDLEHNKRFINFYVCNYMYIYKYCSSSLYSILCLCDELSAYVRDAVNTRNLYFIINRSLYQGLQHTQTSHN